MLWIVAAGNYGQLHWGGTLTDANNDGAVNLDGTTADSETDNVFVAAGGSADLVLQYDSWTHTTTDNIALFAYGYQCSDAACDSSTPINPDADDLPGLVEADRPHPGSRPRHPDHQHDRLRPAVVRLDRGRAVDAVRAL